MVAKKVKPCAQLVRSARYWRAALRLDDWRLEFAPATPEQWAEMEKKNHTAFVVFNAHHRSAQIILRRLDRFDKDLEEDIVHELLHLVFSQFSLWAGEGRQGLDDVPFEQGLNAVSDCLVELKRKEA